MTVNVKVSIKNQWSVDLRKHSIKKHEVKIWTGLDPKNSLWKNFSTSVYTGNLQGTLKNADSWDSSSMHHKIYIVSINKKNLFNITTNRSITTYVINELLILPMKYANYEEKEVKCIILWSANWYKLYERHFISIYQKISRDL